MDITIKIKAVNAAFTDGNLDTEVIRILRDLIDRIEWNGVAATSAPLLDINGNVVGKFTRIGKIP